MKKSFFVLFSFMLLSQAVVGQQLYKPGFVLKSPLDTLHGQIKYISYNQAAGQCIFKNDSGEEVIYNPSDIYGYSMGKELLFHSKTLPDGSKMFLEVRYQGTLTLYSYRDVNQRNFFYLESQELGEFRALTQKVISSGRRKGLLKPFVDVLKIMLPEPELVSDKLEKVTLNAKSLTRLLIDFDQRYAKTKGISYTGKQQKNAPRVGILAGTSFSRLTLNGHNGSANNQSLIFGLRLEKEVSRNTGRLFLSTELLLTDESYTGTYEATQQLTADNDIVSNFINITTYASELGVLGEIEYNTTVSLNRTTIGLPVMLKYKFPGKRFNVTLGTGFSFQYATSDKVQVTGLILQNGMLEAGLLSEEQANPFRIGISTGLGISYRAKRTIFMELRHSPAWFDQGALNYTYTRLMLGLELSKNH